jgi:subfamily B ATP-binding cassette protein HlyB/CyaB
MLRFRQIAADPAQISHQFAGELIGVQEMLRCAKRLKLKARAVEGDWNILAKMLLPAIAALKDGTFIIVGKAGEEALLVQNPLIGRPPNFGTSPSN